MGQRIPIGYLQAAQQFLLTGAPHPFMVVTGHKMPDAEPSTDAMATTVRDRWNTIWAGGARPSTWTLGICRVLARAAGEDLIAGEDSTLTVGTGPGDGFSLSANSALLVRKRTALAGVRNRGRMFVPGFSVNEGTVTEAGYLTGDTQSVHQLYFTAMLAAFVTADMDMVLLHAEEDSEGNPILQAPTPVIALAVQGQIGTQRTRMRP